MKKGVYGMRTIWFDMDGTLNKFYDVPNWLPKLRACDPSPYAEAKVMHNMSILARYLNKVQAMGYHIGIISWLAKNSNASYDEKVTKAKQDWLKKHLSSVDFNEIHIVKYGTPKQTFAKTENDILFDDEEKNRTEWTGKAFDVNEIIEILKGM